MKRLACKRVLRGRYRSDRGWALVAIMTVSVFATMFLFSLAGLSASLLQTEGAARQRGYALAGAEAGLDFAKMQLNKSLITGLPTEIAPEEGQLYRDYGLPVQYLPQLGNRCQVMIRVTRLTDDDLRQLSNRHFYTVGDDVNTSFKKDTSDWGFGDDWSAFTVASSEDAPNGSYTWKVEVTSYCGIFATSLRSVLVAVNSEDSYGLPSSSLNPAGITANGLVEIGPTSGVQSVTNPQAYSLNPSDPNSPMTFSASIRTNGSLSLGDGAELVSDVRISNPGGSTQPVLSITDEGAQPKIYGRVTVNPIPSSNQDIAIDMNGYTWKNNSPSAERSDNILANADQYPGDATARKDINQNPVSQATDDTANPLAPYPVSIPTQTLPLPAFPATPTDPNAPVLPTTLPSGANYSSPYFDSSAAAAQLNFNDTGSGNPTKIFITDSSANPDSSSVNISSRWITNAGDASDLQLIYGGKRPITINLDGSENSNEPALKMTIYAPNASVSTSGTGDFRGAIVAKNVSIKNKGLFQVDPSAAEKLISKIGSNGGGGSNGAGSTPPKPQHYKMLTWQQVSGQLVPID